MLDRVEKLRTAAMTTSSVLLLLARIAFSGQGFLFVERVDYA